MWKLWHRLFGVHFVIVEFGGDHEIRRVKFTPQGRPYVSLYSRFYWLDDNSNQYSRHWEALTFDKKAWTEQFKQSVLPPLRVVNR